MVICGNDSIHHARAVTAYLEDRPRLELLEAPGTFMAHQHEEGTAYP